MGIVTTYMAHEIADTFFNKCGRRLSKSVIKEIADILCKPDDMEHFRLGTVRWSQNDAEFGVLFEIYCKLNALTAGSATNQRSSGHS